nr:MAG TPA: hypothetical protein [Caudoviricetes sp.]
MDIILKQHNLIVLNRVLFIVITAELGSYYYTVP